MICSGLAILMMKSAVNIKRYHLCKKGGIHRLLKPILYADRIFLSQIIDQIQASEDLDCLFIFQLTKKRSEPGFVEKMTEFERICDALTESNDTTKVDSTAPNIPIRRNAAVLWHRTDVVESTNDLLKDQREIRDAVVAQLMNRSINEFADVHDVAAILEKAARRAREVSDRAQQWDG